MLCATETDQRHAVSPLCSRRTFVRVSRLSWCNCSVLSAAKLDKQLIGQMMFTEQLKRYVNSIGLSSCSYSYFLHSKHVYSMISIGWFWLHNVPLLMIHVYCLKNNTNENSFFYYSCSQCYKGQP